MEIQKIGRNLESKKTASAALSTPSFTANPVKVAMSLEDEFLKSVPNKSQKLLKFLKGFKNKFEGEAGGILITAVGTGAVAPFFIGFNPFVRAPKGASEEEKEKVKNTKLYTAMRQPISAALAILFQLSVLKLIDKKFIDPIFNNPKYSKNLDIDKDQSALNGKSYLETLVKKEMKAEGITKASAKAEGKDYSKLVDERVQAKSKKQLDDLARKFERTNSIIIGERQLPNETVADLVNKQIDKYISDANKLKIDANGLARYPLRAECLIRNEKHLREIFKDIPIKEINETTDPEQLKQLYAQTETTLKNLLAQESNKEVKGLLEEMLAKSPDLRASRVARTLERINLVKQRCDGEFSVGKYYEYLCRRNEKLGELAEKLASLKIPVGQEVTEETIKNAIKDIAETCNLEKGDELLKSTLKNTGTFGSDVKKLSSKIYKDITQGYKKMLEHKCKSSNQVIKIIVGVFVTLPITCSALNWVYPRFMELFFPKLAGVKKGPEQNQDKVGGAK